MIQVDKIAAGVVVYGRDIPRCFTVIRSGWKGHYHVIEECPEEGDGHYEHSFLNAGELLDKFGVKLTKRIVEGIKK